MSLKNEGNGTMDNTVVTALYTWYNFVPLNLLKQFQRRQNTYFLIISIMQVYPWECCPPSLKNPYLKAKRVINAIYLLPVLLVYLGHLHYRRQAYCADCAHSAAHDHSCPRL